jgi:ATP-dependent DNA helicase RecG
MKELSQYAITEISGIGPKIAEKLAKLSIRTVEDFCFHLPHRYEDRTRVVRIRDCKPGSQVVIEGEIIAAQITPGAKRHLLLTFTDHSGILKCRFIHFNASQRKHLVPGQALRLFGEVRGFGGQLHMIHPEYESVESTSQITPVEECLTPVYPTTDGVKQNKLRQIFKQILEKCDSGALIQEFLPEPILERFNLCRVHEAIRFVHQPPPESAVTQLVEGRHPMQRRLAFEELVAHQLSVIKIRKSIQKKSAPKIKLHSALHSQFKANLKFNLTDAQTRVLNEIHADLASGLPMLRLVQGDVGSGKTVVAALSMLTAVANGCQTALMAPTEILAEQHFKNYQRWFEALNISVAFLSGSQSAREKAAVRSQLEDGSLSVIIGTHALVQEGVIFKNCGLVVIDEQHRFGVAQRLRLSEQNKSGQSVHQLVMTATPIPRTLAMTVYADLDVSVIDQLPPGRKPITTIALSENRRSEIMQRVQNACKEGKQAYWVCTLIEESEALQCQAAELTAQMLSEQLSDLKIGLIHGRMNNAQKDQVMKSFKAGECQLLVATTVIEVGVDVPNASLMIIENPERLGLAQLHQLRGRVGRGSDASFCVLMYKSPLSHTARARLEVLRETNDGFVIAERDLHLRGPGEMLGTKQTGLQRFRIADLLRDAELLPQVNQAAKLILDEYPEIGDQLIMRWLGNGLQFAKA